MNGTVTPDAPAAVAATTLEERLRRVAKSLRTVARGGVPDAATVHRLRVRTRQAAAALALFDEFLPRRRAARLARTLTRVRRAANDARDGDVLAARLQSFPQTLAVRQWLVNLAAEQADARASLLAVARRLRRRLVRRAEKLLARVRDRGGAGPDFPAWAAARLGPVADDFFAAAPADPADAAALHRFRVCGKRLRYTLELTAPAFAEAPLAGLQQSMAALQDVLGEATDLAVARRRARRPARKARGTLAGSWQTLLADLDARHRAAVQRYAEGFPAAALGELRAAVAALRDAGPIS
jgi:CHAD domain-containing protein